MAVTDTVRPLHEGIRAILSEALGEDVSVDEPGQLTGGASRQVWAAQARTSDGTVVPVVLRRDPPGHGDADRMRAEAACLRAAAAVGVPVPALLASADDAPGIDAPFLLMERVDGESIPRKLQRDPEFAQVRTRLAEKMGFVLGQIHGSAVDELTMLDDRDPLDALEDIYLGLDDPRPAVEIGLRWLREHRPARRTAALVHGDFRLGNVLVDESGIRGVLDWELAHLGDPIEDLGWLCVRAWRFGAQPPVAGIGTREHLLDGYERATGVRPSDAELHWWETFGTLRWLVLSRFQANRHLSGAEHSLELAAIGRRVCESEYDLLLILDLLGEAVPPAEPAPTAPTVHDRPALTEIVALVAETLSDEVAPALDTAHARERYLLRICVNLLGIAGRELDAGADGPAADLLGALDCASEADLAQRIRAGVLPYTDPAVRRCVGTAVLTRLMVANPRHAVTSH
ncbi:phosphotransferase family protein [Rhodococcus gannanensis]|uniref:Phosphotransferase family protein n=1 Tax=Rhodococcus gannanensis TaxID=1960308 RepID=A0ABW4P372_9NOCA